MIIEELTNQEQGCALSVSECGIWITDMKAKTHFAIECSTDILWLIEKLKFLHSIMEEGEAHEAKARRDKAANTKPVSLEEAKAKFSKMRDMLMG